MPRPIHLQPTAQLAERALLPGDPGRALVLAQALLDAPQMFNHHRGLWGYTGTAADGAPLTIQSTGMGGPSAAIVVGELADLGVRRLVRVGTCGALEETLALGDLVVVTEAIAADGASRALGADRRVAGDPVLVSALTRAPAAHVGLVASVDLFYENPREPERQWAAEGALAVEMETAALFALAARRGLKAASILIVSDLLVPERRRIGTERLREAELSMGKVAARALTARGPARPRPPASAHAG